jgi:hypothetical protein
VLATPISGPACVYAPPSETLAIEEPTTLQIPKIIAPLDFANYLAANVSAVSPDWEIAIMTSPSFMIGFL